MNITLFSAGDKDPWTVEEEIRLVQKMARFNQKSKLPEDPVAAINSYVLFLDENGNRRIYLDPAHYLNRENTNNLLLLLAYTAFFAQASKVALVLDTLYVRKKTPEEYEEWKAEGVRPSDDPTARNAIVILEVEADKHSISQVSYAVEDDGSLAFEEPDIQYGGGSAPTSAPDEPATRFEMIVEGLQKVLTEDAKNQFNEIFTVLDPYSSLDRTFPDVLFLVAPDYAEEIGLSEFPNANIH